MFAKQVSTCTPYILPYVIVWVHSAQLSSEEGQEVSGWYLKRLFQINFFDYVLSFYFCQWIWLCLMGARSREGCLVSINLQLLQISLPHKKVCSSIPS